MARPIGAGATGVPIDYSSWADSAWRLGAANAGAFNSVANEVTGILEDRKVKKDQIKVSADLLKAYATINPERADTFNQIAEQLKDEERPLSERAAFAEQVGSLVAMDQDRQKSDRQIAQFAQNYALDLQKANLAQEAGRFELDAAKEDRDLAKQDLANDKEIQSFVAPQILNQVLKQTAAMEQAGQPVFMSSSQLQQALNAADPSQQMKIAGMAMSMFPKQAERKIDKITYEKNGQPYEGMGELQPDGSWKIMPVYEAGSVGNLPAGLAPFAAAFEEAGAKHGVDPKLLAAISIHETGGGTSKAFLEKANAMGISNSKGPTAQASVPASIDRMASLLGSTSSGPYKNADTIAEIAGIYARQGASNDPRGLNKHWAGNVAKIYAQLGGNPNDSVKITPGASKATVRGRTPTQEKLDQANLQIAEQQLIGKERDVADAQKSKNATLAEAEQSIRLLDQLEKHPGFNGVFGAGIGMRFVPGSKSAGADTLYDQVKNRGFLDSIEKIRGTGSLSNAEGEKLMNAANRLDRKLSEKEARSVIEEMKAQLSNHIERLKKAGAEPAVPAAPQSASDRLRSRINAQ